MRIQIKKYNNQVYAFACFVFATVLLNAGGYNRICNFLFAVFALFAVTHSINRSISLGSEEKWFLFFCFVILVRGMLGDFSTAWIRELYSVSFQTLCVIFAAQAVRKMDINLVEICIIAGAMLLGGWAYWGLWTEGNDVRLGDNLLSNSINMGIVLAFAAIILMKKVISDGNKWCILFYGIDVLLLMMTEARGPMLIGLGGSILLFVFEKDKSGNKKKTHRIKLILMIIGIAAIGLGIFGGVFEQYFSRFEEFFYVTRYARNSRTSSTGVRLYLKQLGFSEFLKKPIIGHGSGSARELLNGSFFHDNFIEIAYQYGVFGIIAYYGSFVSAFIKSIRVKNAYAAILIVCLTADGVFDVIYHGKFFYIIFALALIVLRNSTCKEGNFSYENITYNPS